MYVLRQPNPDVSGQVNDGVRRTRRFGTGLESRGGKKEALQFVPRSAKRKRRGEGPWWARREGIFDKSCESIKKLMQRLCEGQIDGGQAEGRRSWFEGR